MYLSRALRFSVVITKPMGQRLSEKLNKMPELSVLFPTEEEVGILPHHNPCTRPGQDLTFSEGEPAVSKIYPGLPSPLPGWLLPFHTEENYA